MTFLRTVPFWPLALAVIIAYYVWELRRSRTLLGRWAENKDLEIISSRRRWVFKGPFFWKSTSGQVVFRVRVRDLHGHEQTGWVLCGNYVTGMVTAQTSGIWDEGDEPFSQSSVGIPRQSQHFSSEPTANNDEYPRATDRPFGAQTYPLVRAAIKWAVRSPLRMISVLVGVLLALLGLIFINYWIRSAGTSVSIGHHSQLALARTGVMVLIVLGLVAWRVRRRKP